MILITRDDGKYWQVGTLMSAGILPHSRGKTLAGSVSAMPQIITIVPEICLGLVGLAAHVASFPSQPNSGNQEGASRVAGLVPSPVSSRGYLLKPPDISQVSSDIQISCSHSVKLSRC